MTDLQDIYHLINKGDIESIKTLINHTEFNINQQERHYITGQDYLSLEKDTPLFAAVTEGKTEIVKFFLSLPGIDVNKGGGWSGVSDCYAKASPLCRAVQSKNLEIVKLLLSHPGVDVNFGDSSGMQTPLGYLTTIRSPCYKAILCNNQGVALDLVSLFLSHPDINLTLGKCETRVGHEVVEIREPLVYQAVGVGNVEVVRVIVSHPKFDMNKCFWKGLKGFSPLSVAAYLGYTDMINLLIEHGADPDYVNPEGKTVYDIAKQSKREPQKVMETILGAKGRRLASGWPKTHWIMSPKIKEDFLPLFVLRNYVPHIEMVPMELLIVIVKFIIRIVTESGKDIIFIK